MLDIEYRKNHLIMGIRVNEKKDSNDTLDRVFGELEESVVVEPISADKGILKCRVLRIRYEDNGVGIRGEDHIVTYDLNKRDYKVKTECKNFQNEYLNPVKKKEK